MLQWLADSWRGRTWALPLIPERPPGHWTQPRGEQPTWQEVLKFLGIQVPTAFQGKLRPYLMRLLRWRVRSHSFNTHLNQHTRIKHYAIMAVDPEVFPNLNTERKFHYLVSNSEAKRHPRGIFSSYGHSPPFLAIDTMIALLSPSPICPHPVTSRP